MLKTIKNIILTLISLLFILLIGTCTLGIITQGVHGPYNEYNGFPAEGSDIYIYRPYPLYPIGGHSFKCSEETYRDYVSKQTDLSEIREVEKVSVYIPNHEKDSMERIQLTGDLLIASWQYTDQGRYFVYDKSSGTTYCYYHTR